MPATASASPLYLDHAATSPCLPEVIEAWTEAARASFGNASARGHVHGANAADAIAIARERVAGLIGAAPADVVFTSGTTEANHLAIAASLAGHDGAVLVGEHDHASVVRFAERTRRPVHQIPCDADGVLDIERMASMAPSAALACLLHGSNEVGGLLELESAVATLRARGICFVHVDAAQTARYVGIDVSRIALDTLALSSHKLGGPFGVAALVCRPSFLAATHPVTTGGGQERGVRAGTHNVPAIVGFGVACRLAMGRMQRDAEHVAALSSRFWSGVVARVHDAVRLGPLESGARLPHIVTMRAPGIPARLLQHEVRDVASIATGAACSSTKVEASATLLSMGLSPRIALEVVRISFAPDQTPAEADAAAEAVAGGIARLRGGATC